MTLSIQKRLSLSILFCFFAWQSAAHNVYFCGEQIPLDNNFVSSKLMDVIRKQVPNVNLPALRQRALTYFPFVESYLRKYNIPQDFKYLPIVESGFMTLSSRVGARGFWQLMPATAKELGLVVSATVDERDDVQKSTTAACRLLAQYFTMIQKKYNIPSWVLTAAAYNFGIGNIFKAINNQGSNYFTMNLNAETAVYVYKIIAVKELFEYPELYMKSFGYNVFSQNAKAKKNGGGNDEQAVFADIAVKVSKKKKSGEDDKVKETFVAAHIKGKYSDFKDGDLISIALDDNLTVQGGFTRKGSIIKGAGWLIDGKIFVDLGYGHELTLYDTDAKKGLAIEKLGKNQPVLLKNLIFDDQSQWKN